MPRHELRRGDGRRVLVYGPLHGGYPPGEGDAAGTAPSSIHKRLDVFTGAWIAVSPARNLRPLDRAVEETGPDGCPFCPGGFEIPFPYEAAVFDNRFPPFRPDPPPPPPLDGETGVALGRAEIVLYTSRHDTSFAELSPAELARVLAVWTDRSRELWADPAHRYVCIFENRGPVAGATIAHPHGQVYALDHVPPLIALKAATHRAWRARGECLSCVAAAADDASSRVVAANRSFAVAVPFAPRWPFEVAVRARRHGARRLTDLDPTEQLDLMYALSDLTRRYDALFGFPLPYMMVAQEAPGDQPDWHLVFEFYPVNRAPEKVKIRAGSETGLGLFLNDVAPEDAAARLAGLPVAGTALAPSELLVAVPAPASAPERGD